MNLIKLLEPNSQIDLPKQLWLYNDKVIATNGFAMIVINAGKVDCVNISPLNIYSGQLSEIINHEYSVVKKIDLQDFKKFLGEPQYLKECDCKNVVQKCPECDGKGVVECNLGEEHDCKECDGGAEYYCDKCDGGWIKPKPRYIGIFDAAFNGNVLAQYLADIHDTDVFVSCDGGKPVKFSGNGWDIFIMPVKDVKQVSKYDQIVSCK